MRTTLHYTESLVRRAVHAFWWRSTGWSYVAALALVVACIAYLIATGDRSWLVGVGGAVIGIGVLLGWGVYVTHLKGSLAKFARMSPAEAVLEVDDDRLRLESSAGKSDIPWNTTTDLWKFPEFWLLFLSRSQFITLPLADLDLRTRETINQRCNCRAR